MPKRKRKHNPKSGPVKATKSAIPKRFTAAKVRRIAGGKVQILLPGRKRRRTTAKRKRTR